MTLTKPTEPDPERTPEKVFKSVTAEELMKHLPKDTKRELLAELSKLQGFPPPPVETTPPAPLITEPAPTTLPPPHQSDPDLPRSRYWMRNEKGQKKFGFGSLYPMNENIKYSDYEAICQTEPQDTTDGWTRLHKKIESSCIATPWPTLVWKVNGDVVRQVRNHFSAMEFGNKQVNTSAHVHELILGSTHRPTHSQD